VISYRVFGVHDWSARIPIALAAVFALLGPARYARWAFGKAAGFYAGLSISDLRGTFSLHQDSPFPT